ncbi:MAG TPA: hypothetical protein VGG62_16220 [Terracidiphilus sp.]|jgi:hypothetical protein
MKGEDERKVIAAVQSIAYSLKQLVKITQKQFDLEHPPEQEQKDAEVYKAGEGETEAGDSAQGRFERLYRETQE